MSCHVIIWRFMTKNIHARWRKGTDNEQKNTYRINDEDWLQYRAGDNRSVVGKKICIDLFSGRELRWVLCDGRSINELFFLFRVIGVGESCPWLVCCFFFLRTSFALRVMCVVLIEWLPLPSFLPPFHRIGHSEEDNYPITSKADRAEDSAWVTLSSDQSSFNPIDVLLFLYKKGKG